MLLSTGFVPFPLNNEITMYWTMWGTIATAIATVGLIVLATFAWRAALGTIRAQTNSDQISALAEYVKALNSLSRVSKFSFQFPIPYDMRDHQDAIYKYESRLMELSQQVESAATIWRAHHKTVGGEMAAFAEADYFLIESIEWWRDAGSDCEPEIVTEQQKLWTAFARDLSRSAAHWQVNEKERSKTAGLVQFKLDRYFHESPLLPESLEGYEADPEELNAKRRKRRSW